MAVLVIVTYSVSIEEKEEQKKRQFIPVTPETLARFAPAARKTNFLTILEY